MDPCTNRTLPPFHIPGYTGAVPGLAYDMGKTYSKATHSLMSQNLLQPGPKGRRPGRYADPCRGHEADLRSRFHFLQGEIDPNPCEGTDWNSRNKFCVQKPVFECPPKLSKNNQHGYLSRLSVYQSPDLGVIACKAGNTSPCKGREPLGKPFWQEYEDITDYDPFQEYPPECRHLRLPKLKPETKSCWDEEYFLPVECVEDYARLGYIRHPGIGECLPLDPRADDSEIKYYHHEPDARSFEAPYFTDPTNPSRFFKSGFTGHVPTNKFRIGETYSVSTKRALNRFTLNYITPHLLERCPVYIDSAQYCDPVDYFKKACDRRKTYDGHFHEKPIRDRLKKEFNPKDCPRIDPKIMITEPFPICIQAPFK